MINNLFTPEDQEAKWKSIYELGINATVNTLFTWNDFVEQTGFDIQDGYRNLIYQANKKLLKNKNRLFKSVRLLGYKIAEPSEQLKQAETRPLRASRQIKKGIIEATYIDKEKMNPDEIERNTHLLVRLQNSLQVIRKKNIKALQTSKKAKRQQEKAITEQENAIDKINTMMNELQNMRMIFGKQSSKVAA